MYVLLARVVIWLSAGIQHGFCAIQTLPMTGATAATPTSASAAAELLADTAEDSDRATQLQGATISSAAAAFCKIISLADLSSLYQGVDHKWRLLALLGGVVSFLEGFMSIYVTVLWCMFTYVIEVQTERADGWVSYLCGCFLVFCYSLVLYRGQQRFHVA